MIYYTLLHYTLQRLIYNVESKHGYIVLLIMLITHNITGLNIKKKQTSAAEKTVPADKIKQKVSVKIKVKF